MNIEASRNALLQESGVSDQLSGPLDEGTLVNLAHQILEIHANRNLRAFLQEIWGALEQISSVALYSVETMGEEKTDSIGVWDLAGNLLLPDLSLPYWKTVFEQVGDTPAVLLEEGIEKCKSDLERIQTVNRYLRYHDTFKEMGLPASKGESPFFQSKTRLSDVPMDYPHVYYLKPMKAMAESTPLEALRVDDEEIMAFLSPDECPGIEFDIRPWLVKAPEGAVVALRECSYGGNYLSDAVAQDMRASDKKVSAIMAYCEVLNRGFTCAVPIEATEAWIRRHRPQLVIDLPVNDIQREG